MATLLVLIMIGIFGRISGQPSICLRKPIHTTAAQVPGDNGFSILVKGLPYAGVYEPGETYSGELYYLNSFYVINGGVVVSSLYRSALVKEL